MSETVFARLQLLGGTAVERDGTGLPRVAPSSPEAVAQVCSLAHQEGWRIRVEGRATWLDPDGPADLALSLRGLDRVVSVSPADLVATVQAGATMDTIRGTLADQGMWLAVDPPGRSDRSLGSVAATATSGPLRHGFGPVRDQVLGCTFVTGDGRIVKAGGRVVKNVAGYDLTRLQVGGFGGFGVLTELHLRLRAIPRADSTVTTHGDRDRLLGVARDLLEARVAASALELFSPLLVSQPEWVLAARLVGTEGAVQAEVRRLPHAQGRAWSAIGPERRNSFWVLSARAALLGPVTLRLCTLSVGLEETLDLLAHALDQNVVSAGAADGTIRWTGTTTPERLRRLRREAAAREIPLTLERAPWDIRHAVGHFGAYREGVGPLVERLRAAFDPGQRFCVALEGSTGE